MRKFRKEVDYYWYNFDKLVNSKNPADKKWIKIISDIKEKYAGTNIGEMIRLKYEMKQKETNILYLLGIERTTYYAWLNKLTNEITLRAAYERLIKPF